VFFRVLLFGFSLFRPGVARAPNFFITLLYRILYKVLRAIYITAKKAI
jgi:hypothetical protein